MKKESKVDINECAARKLDNRELSKAEMKSYLKDKGYDISEIGDVILRLEETGYLDDQRFAASYIAYEVRKNRSKKKAFYDLGRKGVSGEDIEIGYGRYVEEYGEIDEHELALKEAERVLAEAGMASGQIPEDKREKIKGRIGRRLFSRGFDSQLIYGIISEVEANKSDI